MGNKFCSNCDNICPYNKNIETNLSKEQISNEVPEDDIILSIQSSQKNNIDNNEIDKRLNEIIILNKVRKIIKAYKKHLNSINLTERENFSNSNKKNYMNETINDSQNNTIFESKLKDNNIELSSRSSRDEKLNEEYRKNNNNELSYCSNDKQIFNYQIRKKTNYLKMNIPKIQFKNNISNEKEGSTLSASISKEDENIIKTERKNISFINPMETNLKSSKNKNNLYNFTESNSPYSINKIENKTFKNIEKGRNIRLRKRKNDTFESIIKNNCNKK